MSLLSILHHDLALARSNPGMDPTESQTLQWSEAFDAMSSAAHPAVVEVAFGVQAHVAVSVTQVSMCFVAQDCHGLDINNTVS